MTDFTQHLATLGPIAIALGAAFEGQTAVIAGGVLARQQILSPVVVIGTISIRSSLQPWALISATATIRAWASASGEPRVPILRGKSMTGTC